MRGAGEVPVIADGGIKYSGDLAKALRLSEPSIKRLFSEHTLALSRIEEICVFLEVDFFELAKLARGEVKMHANDCLSPQLLSEGWVLTCQSRCVSREIRIEYPD